MDSKCLSVMSAELEASVKDESEEECVSLPVEDDLPSSNADHPQFTIDTLPEGMSKTQWKKKLRLQEKRKKWEKQKQEAKLRKKERQKEKKEQLKLAGPPPPKKKKLEGNDRSTIKGTVLPRGHFSKMSDTRASSVKVAVDCSFEDLMSAQEHLKLLKQLQRCYAANRRSISPFQYYITSYGGKMKTELECRYPVTKEHENWDVFVSVPDLPHRREGLIHYRSESYMELFGKENTVYLLAESPNVLTELDPSKAYIIGGLVDHNHHKGHCYKLAQDRGLTHARLPISEYIHLNSRRVLTINHVYEILLAFSTNGGDWKKAFYQVIPQRKLNQGASSVTDSRSNNHDNDGVKVQQEQVSNSQDNQEAETSSQSHSATQRPSTGEDLTLAHDEHKQCPKDQTSNVLVNNEYSKTAKHGSDLSSRGDETESEIDKQTQQGDVDYSSSDSEHNLSFDNDIHSQLEPCIPEFDY